MVRSLSLLVLFVCLAFMPLRGHAESKLALHSLKRLTEKELSDLSGL